MRLPRVLLPGALYHVCSRGNNHASIFLDDADRQTFLGLLGEVKREFGVRLYAYLLLEDLFHLLVETPNGNLGKVMQRLNQGYTRAFNRRHQRSGHLFESRYKCRLVQKDRYRMALIRYLHLVPAKTGLAKSAAEYGWSSHGEYAAPRPGGLTDARALLVHLSEDLDRACVLYGQFLTAGISAKDWAVLDRKRNGILGDAQFRRDIRETRTRRAAGNVAWRFHEERAN